MPFAGYENWDACINDQLKAGKSKQSADKICGRLKADHEKEAKKMKENLGKFEYSFDIKSVNSQDRIIQGIGSLEVVDRDNEIISMEAIDKGLKIVPLQLGNLESKRDWGHAQDYVEGIWRMVNQEEYNKNFEKPKDYVIATGETHTIREFLEKALTRAGVPFKRSESEIDGQQVEYFNPNTGDPLVCINPKYFRPAEVNLLLGNPSAIENDLGWERKISFENLIERMVDKCPKNCM